MAGLELDFLPVLAAAGRHPARRALPEPDEGVMRKSRAARGLEGLSKGARDRKSGPVANLEQASAARSAAARETVAAVLARELDAVLLEPVDRVRRLGRQDADQVAVGGLVRAPPDVLRVKVGRVVVAESCLDASLGFGRIAGLESALGRKGDAGAGPFGRDGGRKPGGTAPDYEHVEMSGGGHGRILPANR